MLLSLPAVVGIVAMSSPSEAPLPEGLSLEQALAQSQIHASLRLRYEDVNSEDQGAQALTLRTQFSAETAPFYYVRAMIQGRAVTAIPDDDNYNTGVNGENDDLLVEDPELAFLNQYWLTYEVANTQLRYGRQVLTLDDGRLLGEHSFRQAGSSVVGLTVFNESLNFLKLSGGRLHHFISPLEGGAKPDKNAIDASFFHADYRGIIHSHLSAYYLDIDGKSNQADWGSRTQGLRFSGDIRSEPRLRYLIDYAYQTDSGSNTKSYHADYLHWMFGVTYKGVFVSTGQERLGAEEDGFFVTPLGDLHRFQGGSDVFNNAGLGNIEGGIDERYGTVGYHWTDNAQVNLSYRRYRSIDAGADLGNLGDEFELMMKYREDWFSLEAGYADYRAERYAEDIDKLWLSVGLEF